MANGRHQSIFMRLAKKLMLNAPSWLRDPVTTMYKGLFLFSQGWREIFVMFSSNKFLYVRLGNNRYQYESYVSEMLKKYFLKPWVDIDDGDIVFDVGAHTGGFTLAVAEKAKKVIAIEPDPRIFAVLKRNVKGLSNVVTINKALWNHNCVMRLNLSSEPTSSSLLKTEEQDLNVSFMVKAVRLDSLMSDLGIKEIDFLKIDAEGAEPEVLMGMEDVRRIRKAAIDCTPERFGETTITEVKNIFESVGFNVLVGSKGARADLVYAWRPI